MPPIDITPKQYKVISGLLQRHLPAVEAWAYGSRAKRTSRPQSDLDMVVFAKPEHKHQVADLREAFEESNLPFRVDLFVWDEMPESFRNVIEEGHVVLTRVDCAHKPANHSLADFIEMNEATYSPNEKWSFINYLDTGNITENRIANIQYLIVDQDKIPNRARKKARSGDIIYSLVRPIQKHHGLLKQIPKNFIVSTGFSVFRGKPNIADTGFIYYYLTQNHVVDHLQTIAEHNTSAYPSIRSTDIQHLQINLPPLPTQQAIARILSTLDKKIELNRRMNETLEAMAQAIFKDWFVDFGPVRHKMEGREPYLSSEIWELFPDALDDEGKPSEWKVSTIKDCFELTMGQSPPSETYNETRDGLPFFQGRTDFGFRYPTNRKYCTNPSRTAEKDDTLVSVRAPVGDINVAWEKCCIGRGIASICHKSGKHSFTCYSIWGIQQKLREYEHTGTVFGSINKKQFEALEVLQPPENIIAAFENTVRPMDRYIRRNSSEDFALAQSRDLLLPKLLSGKICLQNTKKTVETMT